MVRNPHQGKVVKIDVSQQLNEFRKKLLEEMSSLLEVVLAGVNKPGLRDSLERNLQSLEEKDMAEPIFVPVDLASLDKEITVKEEHDDTGDQSSVDSAVEALRKAKQGKEKQDG